MIHLKRYFIGLLVVFVNLLVASFLVLPILAALQYQNLYFLLIYVVALPYPLGKNFLKTKNNVI